MRASFQKYGNEGQEKWGVRIDNVGGGDPMSYAHKQVQVTKRNGQVQTVALGNRVTSWNAGRVAVYAIAAKDRPRRPRREQQNNYRLRSSIEVEGRKAREEFEAAQAALASYDPADFEWFDGETEIQEAHELRLRVRVMEAGQKLTQLREAYRAAVA